ncbi:MAG: ribonuclease P protein component [bacterium]
MKQYAFPKEMHLTDSDDFRRLYRQGEVWRDRYFVMYLERTGEKDSKPFIKVGFTVSKKVGNSPVRNRLKRLLREIFRLNRSRLTAGGEIVLVVRREAAGLDYKGAREAVIGLLKKAGLIDDKTGEGIK